MAESKTSMALREGRSLGGCFVPHGLGAEVSGVLSWSSEGGALLELIGDTRDWPQVRSAHFVVHGRLGNGEHVSLLHAWVKTVAMGDQVTALRSSTLALGGHVDLDMRWPRAIYSTANLSEWRRDSGLAYSYPALHTRPDHLRIDWRPPTRDEVEVDGAHLLFGGASEYAVGELAEWSITTWQDLVVNLDQPLTLEESWQRYASPLLNLTSFASDRPDGIVREMLIDVEGRRIELWRQGRTVRPRPWEPIGSFLFHAEDLSDYPEAIKAWWALDEQLRPALGLYAEHISYGSSYSPARFLTLYTAMEVYARERCGRKNLRLLRDHAEVAHEVTGCTDEGLKLIGAARDYFAHLNTEPDGPTIDEVKATMLLSTRRASALMQACLLRDLGFSVAEVEKMLHDHYCRWPLS